MVVMLNTRGLIVQNKVNGSFLLLCLVKNILWNHQIFIILDIEIVCC